MLCLRRMTILALLLISAFAGLSHAAEVQPPSLNPSDFSGFYRKLEPDKLLTSGGMKVPSGTDVTVEPEFGVSHVKHQRELGSGYDDISHRVHALAGGKVKLSDSFYLGFATKLPVYNYGTTEGRSPGGGVTPSAQSRHDYEILRLSPNNLSWTGEVGFRLGQQLDLNLYYDQNILKGPSRKGLASDEEVIGTRFILKFK